MKKPPVVALIQSLAGLDATVYFPLVDFKFTNDSPYWILMETDATCHFANMEILFNIRWAYGYLEYNRPAEYCSCSQAVFCAKPGFKPGQITQTDYAANGADVDVTRTVMKNGAVYFKDEFKTHYEAWQAVCEYAPGMADPRKNSQTPKSLCGAVFLAW